MECWPMTCMKRFDSWTRGKFFISKNFTYNFYLLYYPEISHQLVDHNSFLYSFKKIHTYIV